MSKKSEYEKKTQEYIVPLLDSHGFFLYDIEYVKEQGENYLRVYIDKPDGITIDDCVAISREMNEILDREDYISDAYTFEVSSPGVERRLRKPEHFTGAVGEKIVVKLFAALNGKKELEGFLESFDNDAIGISCDDELHTILLKDIAIARLAWKE